MSNIQVVAYDVVGGRVRAALTIASHADPKPAIEALANQTSTVAIKGTGKVLAKNGFTHIVGAQFAAATEVQEATATNRARMTSLSHNMFMDRNQSVWREQDGKLVKAQQTEEELDAVFASCAPKVVLASGTRALTALSSAYASAPKAGMFGAFVVDNKVNHGYIVAADERTGRVTVLPWASNMHGVTHVSVSADDVIYSDFPHNVAQQSPKACASDVTLTQAIEYYRDVYGYNKDYFKRYIENIKSHNIY